MYNIKKAVIANDLYIQIKKLEELKKVTDIEIKKLYKQF